MYRQLISWRNLLKAYRKAAKGKRGNACVAAFEHRLEEHLIALQYALYHEGYRPGAYENFLIHEPKRRLISAAPFADRVVHHALCNLIAPLFERSFIHDSYANRKGKGTHRALDRCQAFARRFRYVLSIDIRRFFPSIDHAVLTTQIERKVSDKAVLRLIGLILAGGAGILKNEYEMVFFPGDDRFAVNRPRGLPIGNLTSQFWANVYLNGVDHFVKRELRCKGYIRYVDDMLLFADDKSDLWRYRDAMVARLARLRLTIHPAVVRPVSEGIPFLGFVVYPDRRRLKRRKGIYYQRKLRRMASGLRQTGCDIDALNASLSGWINHVRFGNTVGLQKALVGEAARLRPAADLRIRVGGLSPPKWLQCPGLGDNPA